FLDTLVEDKEETKDSKDSQEQSQNNQQARLFDTVSNGGLGGPAIGYDPRGSSSPSYSVEVQQEFETLKDALQKIRLQNTHKLLESRTGIKRADQDIVTILGKLARYTEVAFKWLYTQDPSNGAGPLELQQLFTILSAQMNCFQSEYTALVVNNTCDDDTSKLYKALQRNPQMFNDESRLNLHTAANIASRRRFLAYDCFLIYSLFIGSLRSRDHSQRDMVKVITPSPSHT
ncbi:unnamed protein product, partial [Owenia fusiformis]